METFLKSLGLRTPYETLARAMAALGVECSGQWMMKREIDMEDVDAALEQAGVKRRDRRVLLRTRALMRVKHGLVPKTLHGPAHDV